MDSRCIETSSLKLNPTENALIRQWKFAFYTSRKMISLDIGFQPRILALFNQSQENFSDRSNFHKNCKAMLASFLLKPIQRILNFVKMLPDFMHLDGDDQINLLNGGAIEIFIFSATSLYDQLNNRILNLVSRENSNRHISSCFTSNPSKFSSIQLDILKMIWSEVGFLCLIKYRI